MEKLDLITLLGRTEQASKVEAFLKRVREERSNLALPRGLYVHGPAGCGKTTFVMTLLDRLGYEAVVYGAGDVRNRESIDKQ